MGLFTVYIPCKPLHTAVTTGNRLASFPQHYAKLHEVAVVVVTKLAEDDHVHTKGPYRTTI